MNDSLSRFHNEKEGSPLEIMTVKEMLYCPQRTMWPHQRVGEIGTRSEANLNQPPSIDCLRGSARVHA